MTLVIAGIVMLIAYYLATAKERRNYQKRLGAFYKYAEKPSSDIRAVEYPVYVEDDWIIAIKVIALVSILAGASVFVGCNIGNKISFSTAKQKAEMYQEFVDEGGDRLLSTTNGDIIANWNNEIIQRRYYQESPIFRTHYIFSGDWNEVPLVRFGTEQKGGQQ